MSKRRRKTTTLNTAELRLFVKARQYVRSMCGKVSDAEVLRYMIRDWVPR